MPGQVQVVIFVKCWLSLGLWGMICLTFLRFLANPRMSWMPFWRIALKERPVSRGACTWAAGQVPARPHQPEVLREHGVHKHQRQEYLRSTAWNSCNQVQWWLRFCWFLSVFECFWVFFRFQPYKKSGTSRLSRVVWDFLWTSAGVLFQHIPGGFLPSSHWALQ